MKNVFKRICCLIISAAVCTGTFAFAAEDGNQPQLGKSLTRAMYFLRELGIIGDYFEYNTDVSEKITRAEFADVVAKAINRGNTGRRDTYFYDVPSSHFAYEQINALAELGFVDGVGNNCFDPDSYINTASACKIILSVLGYDKTVMLSGADSIGYIKKAAELELIGYAAGSSVLTREEMFNMIFESLITPMYEISGSKGSNVSYTVDEEKTILDMYHGAVFEKGVIDGVRTESFDGTSLMENEVEIGGMVYTARSDFDDMLGEEVEFIAYMDENRENGEIATVLRTGKTDVLYISEKDFDSFDKAEYKLSYTDANDKSKSIRIERDVRLIYNGGLIESNISDRINEGCDLKIIKSTNGYDRIVAKKKKNITVKSIDTDNEYITNMASSPKTFVYKDCEMLLVKKDGDSMFTPDKIVSGNVLSIYESYPESPGKVGDFIEIRVSDDKITGVIEKISNNDGTWITVNGIEYRDLSGCAFKAGNSAELYLDIDGDIAYAESVEINNFAAYLIEGRVFTDYNLQDDEMLRIEMFKQDGKTVKLICDEKVIVDGDTIKGANGIFARLTDSTGRKFKSQLALVKTNSEGFISAIDTANGNGEEGTLTADFEKISVMYRNVGYFGNNEAGTVALGSNTIYFRVPPASMVEKGETTEEDYGIGINGYIEDFDWITASSYRTTQRKAGYAEYVVYEKGGKGSSVPWPVLVESVSTIYDEKENEVLDAIVGYDGYKNVTIPIKEDTVWRKKGADWAEGNKNMIEKGMVVSFVKNSLGHATEVDLIYDRLNGGDYYTTGNDYNGRMNEVGIVEDASDKLLVLKIGKEGSSVAVKADDAEIMVCDGGKEIRKGTFTDAKLYSDSYDTDNPETYSDAVVFQWDRRPLRVYIFK